MLKLKVSGMTCGGCAASIQRALGQVIPGTKVSVDLAKGEVTIDGTPSKEQVIGAIEDAGYDVTGEAA